MDPRWRPDSGFRISDMETLSPFDHEHYQIHSQPAATTDYREKFVYGNEILIILGCLGMSIGIDTQEMAMLAAVSRLS